MFLEVQQSSTKIEFFKGTVFNVQIMQISISQKIDIPMAKLHPKLVVLMLGMCLQYSDKTRGHILVPALKSILALFWINL